jgi:chromosome segregation ATPase
VDNIPGYVTAIGAVFALIAVLGAAFAVFRVSFTNGKINDLRGDIQDRNERIDFLEKEQTADKAKIEKLEGLLKSEQQKVKILQDLVTGREQLENLTQLVKAQGAAAHDIAENIDKLAANVLNNTAAIRMLTEAVANGQAK